VLSTQSVTQDTDKDSHTVNDFPVSPMGWCELRDGLAAHVPSNSIQLGRRFSHMQQHDDHVRLHFKDGRPVDAKLVIGADGIFSQVRQQTLDDGPPDFTVRIFLPAEYSH